MKNLDPKQLRNAFGSFMTGVTVVTSHDADSAPIGFTANSITSVSLDPPLLLVCLANSSSNYAAFTEAKGFAVNILAEDQTDVSNNFARPVEDRFAAVGWRCGPHGAPVLDGVCAWFDCSMHQVVEAGDHVLLIGRVEDFEATDRGGLGYAAGGYFTRALENDAANALATGARVAVSAVVERDGEILLHQEGGWRLPAVVDGEDHSTAGQRARLQQSTGLELSNFFIYSLYNDAETRTQHIVYRCTASAGNPTSGCFESLANLSGAAADSSTAAVLKRFGEEASLGNFNVYIGDTDNGEIQPH